MQLRYPYASKCHVLLVDDDRALLKVLATLLTSEGFVVESATNYSDALALFEQRCFHVAVIDVRLDEHDPHNRDGLRLMAHIRARDPSTGVIVLTQHAEYDVVMQALKPLATAQLADPVRENSHPPASDFLTKVPAHLTQLPATVARVFEEVVHINWALTVIDADHLLSLLPQRLRFTPAVSPPRAQLEREIEELVRKLFVGWQRVEISSVSVEQQGASKAVVLRAAPYKADGPGALTIVKLGEYPLIEREVKRYREFIEGRVTNNRCPTAIMPVRRTRSIGGMLYTFLGMGGVVQDFAQFFHHTDDQARIDQVLHNLYGETLLNQHGSTKTYRENADLRAVYTDLLRLNADELHTTLTDLLTRVRAIVRPSNKRKFWLPTGMPLANPVEYALTADFTGAYHESIIHGDLHAHNVLVDHRDETWLIDFANTGRGALLHDYIALEAALLVEVNTITDGRTLLAWSRALFAQPGDLFPELPLDLITNSAVVKAHNTIMTIRRLALNPEHHLDLVAAQRMYLVGLLFTTLRLMTVKFLRAPRRFHALTLAAGITEALQGFDYPRAQQR